MSLVVLGLDGATWRNLQPWIESGDLPNLEALIDGGTKGTLHSTIPCTTVPAVPAMSTGKDPTGLGLFNFTRPDGTVVDAHDIEFPAIWDAIGPEHRSLVANLRSTYPPYDIDGTMISGDLFLPSDAEDYVSPPETYDELSDFHDPERIDRWTELARSPDDHADELLDLAETSVRAKYDHFARLWETDSYDFGLFWIGKTDAIQHHFWHDPERIRSFYQFVDGLIGELIADLDPENLVVLSDHGFGQVPERRFHVNTWLQREGHLSTTGGRVGAFAFGFGQEALTRYVPKKHLRRVYDTIFGSTDSSEETSSDDRILAPAFGPIPGLEERRSAARLTHPWGISVPSGDDAVIDAIVESLKSLEDDGGEPIVQDAWRRESLFTGQHVEEVPEVVFLTTERYRAVPQLSRSLFTERSARRTIEDHPVTGEHNSMRDGIVVLNGPGFSDQPDLTMDITEIAPTLVHLLGRPVPEAMDGEVRTDVLATDRQIERSNISVDRGDGHNRSTTEDEEIRDRLQQLGYLDG